MKKQISVLIAIMILSSGCASSKALTYTGAGLGAAGGVVMGGMFGMIFSGALGGGELDTKGKIILPLSMIIGGVVGAGSGMALGAGLDKVRSD